MHFNGTGPVTFFRGTILVWGHTSRLGGTLLAWGGGTLLAWGAQAVIWGYGPEMPPRGAGPGSLTIRIKEQSKNNTPKNGYHFRRQIIDS